MYKSSILFLLLAIFSQGFGQKEIDKSKFNLVFSEDFENTSLQKMLNSGNWGVGTPWGPYLGRKKQHKIGCRSGYGCKKDIIDKFTKNSVAVENGQLKLKLKKLEDWESVTMTEEGIEQNYDYLYEGGMVYTNVREIMKDDHEQKDYGMKPEEFTGWLYGLFEVDLVIPEYKKLYPSFWLCSKSGRWPEIDAFELDHKNDRKYEFYSNFYQDTDGTGELETNPEFYKLGNNSIYTEVHTWSILWTPEKIVYYLDGEELRTITDDVDFWPSAWRKAVLILGVGPTFSKKGAYSLNKQKSYDDSFEFAIEEVRVYKPVNNNYKLKPY